MNAAKIAAAGEHHQDRLRLGVSRIVLKMIDYAQLCGLKLLGPVTLFTGPARWDQAVALHGGLNRVMDAFENGVNELPGTALFALQPTSRTGSNVATHALNSGMRRVQMGGEFGFHDVTALPAELRRFHVRNRAVCALCPNDDVERGGHSEKDR